MRRPAAPGGRILSPNALALVHGILGRIAPARGAADLTVAVGDVHGRWNAFTALLDLVASHAAGSRLRIVTLGDYVDKGRSSAKVVETLGAMRRALPEGALVTLMGNHERMMLDAAEGGPGCPAWSDREDRAGVTLASYGLPWRRNSTALLPRDHLEALAAMPLRHDDGVRHFVHAGFRPGTAPEDQSADDMLWIKEPFTRIPHDFGRRVVHGHTSVGDRPYSDAFRTGVDTRCGSGRRLTAVVFEGSDRDPSWALSVDADGLNAKRRRMGRPGPGKPAGCAAGCGPALGGADTMRPQGGKAKR